MLMKYSRENTIKFDRLRDYLLKYLTKSVGKGRVVAISGLWGGGKTYFWQKILLPELEKNMEESNIYISLYGVQAIDDIDIQLSYKASKLVKVGQKILDKVDEQVSKNNLLKSILKNAEEAGGEIVKKYTGIDIEKRKKLAFSDSARSVLHEEDIIVCFDDIERKSTNFSLNDFFGYVHDLSETYGITVVIIYNEDYFNDNDKNQYENTKEKLIDKYIEFRPNIGDLYTLILKNIEKNVDKNGFELISSAEYKEMMNEMFVGLNLINARTYEKALNNVFEWLEAGLDNNLFTIRALVLATINFIHYNTILDYKSNKHVASKQGAPDKIKKYYNVFDCIPEYDTFEVYNCFLGCANENLLEHDFIDRLKDKTCADVVEQNNTSLLSLYKFGYIYEYDKNVEDEIIQRINAFVKSGVL